MSEPEKRQALAEASKRYEANHKDDPAHKKRKADNEQDRRDRDKVKQALGAAASSSAIKEADQQLRDAEEAAEERDDRRAEGQRRSLARAKAKPRLAYAHEQLALAQTAQHSAAIAYYVKSINNLETFIQQNAAIKGTKILAIS